MAKYFVLRPINQASDNRVVGFMELEDYKYKRLHEFDLWGIGRESDANPSGPVEIRVVPREKCSSPPIDLYDFSIPLVSARLRGALDAAGVDNVHYAPVTLRNTKTKEGYEYFAFNLLGLVAAADRTKSRLKSHDGDFVGDTSIDGFAIDPKKCRGRRMFRMAEKYSAIVIHEKVKAAIVARGIDTLQFVKPEDFHHI